MGKSTAAQALRRLGLRVHDADAEVHRLLREDRPTITEVAAAFPGVLSDGRVDRTALGRRVFGDVVALRRLEAILHPRVRAAETRFVQRARAARVDLVVVDIPLLYETGGERRCDAVVVVSAPDFVQAARVLHRRGMTSDRLAAIRARQLPDAAKRQRADFIVPTGLDHGTSTRALARIIAMMRRRPACARIGHA
jgi:dephospho-CoA kinase